MGLAKLKKELKLKADEKKAEILKRFFKTAKGEYGEGDKFLGIKIPELRKIAKRYLNLSLKETEILLHNKFHEARLTALIILTYKFPKASKQEKKEIFNLYLKNASYVNNWDLVDLSAPKILGEFLLDKKRSLLYKLAKSKNLWQRRMALLACFAFIKKNDFYDALEIIKLLLKDKHDLIHKAAGWMLREIGKKDKKTLINFLNCYSEIMPRTMLRYSLEKLEEKKRKYYLKKLP